MHSYKHIHNKIKKKYNSTVLISVTSHLIVAGIYNCLPLDSMYFCLCKHLGCSSSPGEATQTFIPEGSEPLIVLSQSGCCSFPLTLITEHDSTV